MSKDNKKSASGLRPNDPLIPSGQIDTVAMATEMSKMKAKKYAFGYYDVEDISQEIWLSVEKSSHKFDPGRTTNPKSFFNVATENALKNLKRDTRIIDNINISDSPVIQIDNSFEDFLELRDMIEYLVVRMPKKYRKAFILMLNGRQEDVSVYSRNKVKDYVTKLMERYRNE